MSMGTIPDNSGALSQAINGMLTCTYDESHSVSGGRYFSHIEACRKAYLEAGGSSKLMLKCPFRSSHHVAAHVMDKHIQLCEGYYEWHRMNQEDPPSMNEDYQGDDDDSKTITDEGECASAVETDGRSYDGDCSATEEESTTSESFASAKDALSD